MVGLDRHNCTFTEKSHEHKLYYILFLWTSFVKTKQLLKLSERIFLSNGKKHVAIISSRSLIKIGNLNCSKLAKHCKSQRREGKARQMQPILDFATADSLCATYGWRDLEVVMTHINFRTIFSFLFSKLSPNWCLMVALSVTFFCFTDPSWTNRYWRYWF